MEINRNQYFLAGLVLLFLGIQFRTVDSFELTPEFTQFLAERSSHPLAAVSATSQSFLSLERATVKKLVRPPDWLGWALLSIGGVLVLHSWAMQKPA
ncbi:MAG: hypothetical protein ABSG68_14375 [Thermoguttaceae bacterium]|jgi:hypothetical protein